MQSNSLNTKRNTFALVESRFNLERSFSSESFNVIGPKKGYSLQIGTLVAMMDWMRMVVLSSVYGMTKVELDFLCDEKANSIGAILLHLAATERFYQVHSFGEKHRRKLNSKEKKIFEIACILGKEGQKILNGKKLDYYLEILNRVREETLRELRLRDDQWLMAVDSDWFGGPTNNYCIWFHVCEHESNHNGQINWIKRRLAN